jgi:hypothetical protein
VICPSCRFAAALHWIAACVEERSVDSAGRGLQGPVGWASKRAHHLATRSVMDGGQVACAPLPTLRLSRRCLRVAFHRRGLRCPIIAWREVHDDHQHGREAVRRCFTLFGPIPIAPNFCSALRLPQPPPPASPTAPSKTSPIPSPPAAASVRQSPSRRH